MFSFKSAFFFWVNSAPVLTRRRNTRALLLLLPSHLHRPHPSSAHEPLSAAASAVSRSPLHSSAPWPRVKRTHPTCRMVLATLTHTTSTSSTSTSSTSMHAPPRSACQTGRSTVGGASGRNGVWVGSACSKPAWWATSSPSPTPAIAGSSSSSRTPSSATTVPLPNTRTSALPPPLLAPHHWPWPRACVRACVVAQCTGPSHVRCDTMVGTRTLTGWWWMAGPTCCSPGLTNTVYRGFWSRRRSISLRSSWPTIRNTAAIGMQRGLWGTGSRRTTCQPFTPSTQER